MPLTNSAGGQPADELDNRLSLDPNDDRWAETIGDWSDGKEYTVEATVRQVSPGEFEVVGLTASGEEPEEGEEEEEVPEETGDEEETPAPAAPAKSGYRNPAVIAMAAGRQK